MNNFSKISNGVKLNNRLPERSERAKMKANSEGGKLHRLTNLIAACLLLFLFLVCLFSMAGDSLTMDELAHLPAGYSYLTQKDMRLNPEHPPLIKDLAAVPLVFIKGINFPSEIKSWEEDINGQWDFGNYFLFKSRNPTDKMIFWGRIPMILVLILLGFYIFKWSREYFGNKVALLSLFLFSFSPTFLAHGRLVTTDVGAAAGVFIATYYFIKSLQNPSRKNIIFAGIAFGLAELCKFTVIILIPFFAVIAFFYWLTKSLGWKTILKIFILVLVIGYLLIWPVYLYHTWNYPTDGIVRDIKFLLSSHPFQFLGPLVSWMAENPLLKPYAEYLLGLSLVYQRGVGGHTTYFLGEVSSAGWNNYFPVVYSIKEPLTFHILTVIALLYLAWLVKRPFYQDTFSRFKSWLSSHFVEFSMIFFVIVYWIFSLIANLNIGVRHLLPAFPFTFVLVSAVIVNLLKEPYLKLKYIVLGALILWQTISVVSVYPYFLTYFNEIAGGSDRGYIYTVNSNLDWGQDLKRLKKWVDEKGIDKIYVDYFGGADTKYYLKEKFAPWRGTQDPKELPKGSYLAVSATFLEGGRGFPVSELDQPYGYYLWLNQYKPITKIGYSIFVYRID